MYKTALGTAPINTETTWAGGPGAGGRWEKWGVEQGGPAAISQHKKTRNTVNHQEAQLIL